MVSGYDKNSPQPEYAPRAGCNFIFFTMIFIFLFAIGETSRQIINLLIN